MLNPKIFKAYDVRAEVGVELDAEGVRRIAQAIVLQFHPKTVGVGRDMRQSGPEWSEALMSQLLELGVNITDLGVISTDASYFAAGTMDLDYVIMITASHNPPRYNGFKISKRGGIPLEEEEMMSLRDLAAGEQTAPATATPGTRTSDPTVVERFVKHALTLVQPEKIKPLRILVDAGNGMAGKLIPELEKLLPIQVTPMFFELDGSFPNHLANPLIEDGQRMAREKAQAGEYDLVALFDGDGDRMFMMTEQGEFVSGTVTTAIVAEQLLKMHPKSHILYNAICGRIVPELVERLGGTSFRTRVGHVFIKRSMREQNAIFGGEHSGHYFFRDFFSTDSGLVAFLFALQYISEDGRKFSEIVHAMDTYPSSGEINFEIEDKDGAIAALKEKYQATAQSIDDLDGVSIWFADWWANVRPSNTQPVLRLNVEANNKEILDERTKEIMAVIQSKGGVQTFE